MRLCLYFRTKDHLQFVNTKKLTRHKSRRKNLGARQKPFFEDTGEDLGIRHESVTKQVGNKKNKRLPVLYWNTTEVCTQSSTQGATLWLYTTSFPFFLSEKNQEEKRNQEAVSMTPFAHSEIV